MIGDLTRPQNKLEPIEGMIEQIGNPRTINLKSGGQSQVAEAILSDGTGKITVSLWDDQIRQVKSGSRIRIENGYISSFKGKNSLNIGKFGKLIVIEF